MKEYQDQRTHQGHLKEEIEKFMQDYDFQVKQEEKKIEESWNQPDEEGFIKVMPPKRHKKQTDAAGAKVQGISKTAGVIAKKREKNKKLKDFYAFQLKESKRERKIFRFFLDYLFLFGGS